MVRYNSSQSEKTSKDIGVDEVSEEEYTGDLKSDEHKILNKLHEDTGGDQVTSRRMKGATSWLVMKALNDEH